MLRFICSLLFLAFTCRGAELDLANATVILDPGASARDKKAAQVLVEEVEKRSRIRWSSAGAPAHAPSIHLKRGGTGAAESYSIKASASGVSSYW